MDISGGRRVRPPQRWPAVLPGVEDRPRSAAPDHASRVFLRVHRRHARLQILFLLISTDPVRYRPAMPVAVLEKAAFAVAAPILFAMQRVGVQTLAFSMIDGLLGVLFVMAY